MRDAAYPHVISVRLITLIAILAFSLGGPPSLPGQAADPSKPIAPPGASEARGPGCGTVFGPAYRPISKATSSGRCQDQGIAPDSRITLPEGPLPPGPSRPCRGPEHHGLSAPGPGLVRRARVYFERALAMCESLYPKARYPQGHPDLAISLNNLGALLQAQGSYGEARGYFERALAMHQSLYPKDRYPQGHPDLAISLNNLGSCSRPRARTARRGATTSERWR